MLEQNENSAFRHIKSIKIGNVLLDFSTSRIMGIVNLSPDSFYDGGKLKNDNALLKQVERHLSEGADILDLGAFSSRPGASLIEENEERRRLIPAISLIRSHFPKCILSIDTYRSEIAKEAVNEGAHIINDISGGDWDERLIETVSELKCPYVLMHTPGKPEHMQSKAKYHNVSSDVFQYLQAKLKTLRQLGLNDVIVDPGFGFGKLLEHNYQLLANLNLIAALDCPILVGLSRKKMIQEVIQSDADKALNATTAAHVIALLNGANILRVHDVKAAREAISIVSSYQKFNIVTA